jgi:hypothetical protein
LLAKALSQATSESTGARGQGGTAGRLCHLAFQHLDPPPKNARAQTGQKRHGLGGFDQQRRVEGARGDAGVITTLAMRLNSCSQSQSTLNSQTSSK